MRLSSPCSCPLARRLPAALLWAAIPLCAAAENAHADLAQINTALQAGEADKALELIAALPQAGADDAAALNLECRIRYTLSQWDAAASACERAVNLDGQSSNDHLWLGRALGERADRASFLNAFSLGKRVRAEFEEAVRLDPRNGPALSDLGEFYKEAPGVIGGGTDKAESIAAQLERFDPARAHQLRAGIAESRKDYATAEQELKQSIAASTHPAFQWTVLASFYRHRQRIPDMESAIHSCVTAAAHDRTAGVALYDGAGVLISARRDPELAAKMLQDYLSGSSKTEEAPAFIAHYLLARLLDQLGDAEGARREQAAGYNLAHEYQPPQDARR
jgi:tetratricopeptide (TPR) repeat protein